MNDSEHCRSVMMFYPGYYLELCCDLPKGHEGMHRNTEKFTWSEEASKRYEADTGYVREPNHEE